jgi:hypothetical protein
VAGYRIKNEAELDRLPRRQREAWERAGDAIATHRREGITLRAAARREGTTVSTIRKYFAPAVIRNGERGWYRATRWDRAYRGRIHLLTEEGDVMVEVRDSRARSLAAQHVAAVNRYRLGFDPQGEGLRRFRGRRIGGYRLLDDRDLDLIDEIDRRGDSDWPDLYDRGL